MKNIEKYFSLANDTEVKNGLSWYSNSHNCISEIADKYGIEHEIAYAVTSALSPRCIWETNLKDLEKVLEWHTSFSKKSYLPIVTTYVHNLKKAINTLQSKNTNVFKTCKTFNFFNNLLNPESGDYVTIDGHSINIYYGKTGMVKHKHFTKKYYNRIAMAYRKVAKKYNILPCQMQAITWLAFKRIHNIRVNWRYYQGDLPF
jgi:hypothetical protein